MKKPFYQQFYDLRNEMQEKDETIDQLKSEIQERDNTIQLKDDEIFKLRNVINQNGLVIPE